MSASNADPALALNSETTAKTGFIAYLKQHPKGFWFIFWGEFAERCSYYGMMAILARFIAERMGFGQQDSNTYVSFFKAGCYFLPLLGGFLADNFFGKYKIIVLFSIPYILGHLVLSIETPFFMILALALLAMGSGVIKPNISALMGMTYDQQRPGQETLRSNAFAIFYMSINIGAAISFAALPPIRTEFGYSIAFMVPAALMGLAFVLFAIGKPYYATETIIRKESTPEERRLKWETTGRVAGLFLLISFFWAIFDQSHTTWVFFAVDYMDLTIFGMHFDPEQFGTLNPLLIIIFVPIVTYLFNRLDARGIRVRPTDKMIVGFLLTAICMGVMAFAGSRAGEAEMRPVMKDGEVVMKDGSEVTKRYVAPEEKVTIWWQVLAFFLITIAEILISVTGLELAFVVAPQSMKGFVTGLWLASVGIANLFFNAPVGRLYNNMDPGSYYAMLTGLMIAVMITFLFVAKRFNIAMDKHNQSEAAKA